MTNKIVKTDKFTYDKITETLGVGKSKISNVHKNLLQDDSGYKIIVKRLLENRKNRLKKIKKENKNNLSPMGVLKKKYPAHFLLPNLLDAALEKLEDDKSLEKEALLFTPSSTFFKK